MKNNSNLVDIGGTLPTVAPTTSLKWDPFCGPLWSRDLLSNYCYLFNTDPMIWVDAKHQCEYQGGKLLSIVSRTVGLRILECTSISYRPEN